MMRNFAAFEADWLRRRKKTRQPGDFQQKKVRRPGAEERLAVISLEITAKTATSGPGRLLRQLGWASFGRYAPLQTSLLIREWNGHEPSPRRHSHHRHDAQPGGAGLCADPGVSRRRCAQARGTEGRRCG